MKPRIYLAGPIFGATGAEANDWRRDMTARLAPHGIVGISPLRCEPIVGDRYDVAYADPCFGTPEAILGKNFLDLRACDLTLAYMPAPPEIREMDAIIDRMANLADIVESIVGPIDDEAKAIAEDVETLRRLARKSPQRSIGTIGEISWAYALQKPLAIVTDDPLVRFHPFTLVQPNWRLNTLDEAERLIVGLYSDYAK
jgi:nucleoside 2-deoxyribosyltransferase